MADKEEAEELEGLDNNQQYAVPLFEQFYAPLSLPSDSKKKEDEVEFKKTWLNDSTDDDVDKKEFVFDNNKNGEEQRTIRHVKQDSLIVTEGTKKSELSTVPLETISALGGWTAKRVSITGQIFFERDIDGKITTERPVTLNPLKDEEEDSDIEEEDLRPAPPPKSPILRPPPTPLPPTPVIHQINIPSLSIPIIIDIEKEKKPQPLSKEILLKIQSLEGNNRCCDCGAGNPLWSSVAYGVIICVGCAGNHRSTGTHITQVKSLTLDNWSLEQISFVAEFGGNSKFKKSVPNGKSFQRYKTPEAELYRQRMKALVKNETLPEEIIDVTTLPSSMMTPINHINMDEISNNRESTLGGDVDKLTRKEAKESLNCMLCQIPFSVVIRKHYCRCCNRAVCSSCAPAGNTKPLPQLGLGLTPQRHCSKCFQSPFIDWQAIAEGRLAQNSPRRGLMNGGGATKKSFVGLVNTSTSSKKNSSEDLVLPSPRNRGKTVGEKIVGMIRPHATQAKNTETTPPPSSIDTQPTRNRGKTVGEKIVEILKRG